MRTYQIIVRLAVLFLLDASFSSCAAVGDSLAVGDVMRDNETLVSVGGSFALGFFTGNSNRRYLGIWFNKISVRTVVWVANRQRPLLDSTGFLTLRADGSLVLSDPARNSIWSTDPVPAQLNPVARLLDNGNLVVLGGSGGVYLWQSFDHPGDTMLPGMRIGVNLRTRERFNITAWRGPGDPAPGDYSWGIDTRGVPQLLISNKSAMLWRAGPWVGERFSGIPRMQNATIFSYSFTSNSDEVFFKFEMWSTVTNRLILNQSGFMEHFIWEDGGRYWRLVWASANGTCDGLNACGQNAVCDPSGSPVCRCLEGFVPATGAPVCRRNRQTRCPGRDDAFRLVAGAKLPDTSAAKTVEGVRALDECRATCLGNCSCTAFSSSDGGGCILWFGELTDVRLFSEGGQNFYVRVASEGRKDQKKVVITIVVLVTFIVIMVPTLICLCRRRIRMRLQASRQLVEEGHHEEGDQGTDFGLPLFHFSTLQQATDHFSFRNKLGEGGYGPVYMGMLHHPQQSIAIKRLSKDSTQGLEQFKCEVQLVAKLQHRNLVRLLGCCIENDEKILIYEYMVNQSLDKVIFDASKGQELDWAKRLRIIEGISQGLLYLHKYSRLTVIHRDLKASNILLDGDWTPKISDFGLARIFNWNEPQANTKRIIGTYGYMPPEYAMKGLFSIKSDVYSFGVLLLEILTGKKSTSISDFGISQNLPGRAWELWRQGKALEMVDPAMGSSVPGGEFSKCVHVALLCVQENPADRPTMVDVVAMLNSDTAAGMPTPSQPAFFLVRHATTVDGSGSEIEHFSSSNSVTMTRVEGR